MSDLAKFIEHTALRADTTLADVRRMCEEAQKFDFAGICIPPLFVRDARRMLGEDSRIRIVTVVGFPMGYSAIAAKSEEIKRAVDDSVDEIDAVINIAAVKSENWNHVDRDIDSIVRAARLRGKTLKLILECGLLSPAEIRKVCEIADQSQVMWLKTGTGFQGHDATPEMVRTLRAIASPTVKIKAAGGIRTAQQAEALLAAGADRLGTSASIAVIGKLTTGK